MKALGRHLLVELYGCQNGILNNVKQLKEVMLEATQKIGATAIDIIFHKFNPHGVSGLIVIAESHLAIHTWPEYGYASIDIYTCGEEIQPWPAYEYLAKVLEAKNSTALEMRRGLLPLPQELVRHKPIEKAPFS